MKKTKLVTSLLLAGLGLLSAQTLTAKVVTVPASNVDQTVAFRTKVGTLANGDTLVLAAGNHYINGWIDIFLSNGVIQGPGIVRKISGSNSGLNLHGSNTRIDGVEIDGGGGATQGSCMFISGGDLNFIVNCSFHNSGSDAGLKMGNTTRVKVQGTFCNNNLKVGISQSGCTDSQIINCTMTGNGAEGLTIDNGSHRCKVSGSYIHANNGPHRGVGGVGIDSANGVEIWNCTIDNNGADGICFKNNNNQTDNNCNIHNNPNISNNESAAIGIYKHSLVGNLSTPNNTWNGNGYNGVFVYSQ